MVDSLFEYLTVHWRVLNRVDTQSFLVVFELCKWREVTSRGRFEAEPIRGSKAQLQLRFATSTILLFTKSCPTRVPFVPACAAVGFTLHCAQVRFPLGEPNACF